MEQMARENLTVARERAVLVGCLRPNHKGDPHDPLSELRALADTAGAIVVDELLQKRHKPVAATFIGKGKVEELGEMVRAHEIGGNKKTNLLKNADTLSFFDVNLPFYYTRNNREETKRRCLWGLKRLSLDLYHFVIEFKYNDKDIEALVKSCIIQCN